MIDPIALEGFFVTAHGGSDISAAVLRRGAVVFLHKPFSQESVLDAVRSALGRRARMQTSPQFAIVGDEESGVRRLLNIGAVTEDIILLCRTGIAGAIGALPSGSSAL